MNQTNTIDITLIDDDEIANFINKKLLAAHNFEHISTYNDPLIAVKELRNHSPNIILLDINMPKMDGFELLCHLKENNLCPNTKVFVLTSSNRESDSKKAQEFEQVIGYIEKPLDAEKIDHFLANYLAGEKKI